MRQSKIVSICQHAFGVRGVEIAVGLIRIPWLKIIDSLITMSSLVGIVLLTKSFGAFAIVIGFGLWNYWKGLTDHDEREKQERAKMPTPTPIAEGSTIPRSLLTRVKNLEPGGAIRVTCADDEIEFIVIESSDFEHIIDMAGMITRNKQENGK